MLLLATVTDKIQVITGSAVTVDVHATGMDIDTTSGGITHGRKNSAITTAATTDIVDPPSSGELRTVKTITLRNKHATSSNVVTVQHTDGTTTVELIKITLLAGHSLCYDEGIGWSLRDTFGAHVNSNFTAVSGINLVVLASDVTNNNGTANTIQDVTGLSFAVESGKTYWFRAAINYTAAATTTGSRWSVSGPATPTLLSYASTYSLTTTTETVNSGLNAYDLPAASNATSAATAANFATVEGIITPSANGTVIIRFASEVLSSAIIAKAGSILQWARVL